MITIVTSYYFLSYTYYPSKFPFFVLLWIKYIGENWKTVCPVTTVTKFVC